MVQPLTTAENGFANSARCRWILRRPLAMDPWAKIKGYWEQNPAVGGRLPIRRLAMATGLATRP